MLDFLATGNSLRMSIILIIGIIVLVVSIVEVYRRITKQDYTVLDDRLMLSIKALGGIAGLSGLYFQTQGLYLAYQAIMEAADISPMILIKGVFVSFYTTFFGLGIFLVSYILWYLIKLIWMKERD